MADLEVILWISVKELGYKSFFTNKEDGIKVGIG